MEIFQTTVAMIDDTVRETRTILLAIPEGFTWEEGASTHLALPGFQTEEGVDRAYVHHMSICTLPSEGAIGISTRIREGASVYKEAFAKLEVGDTVALFKTHSRMQLPRDGRPVVFLCNGVAAATLRPLVLAYLRDASGVPQFHVVNVDRADEDLYEDVIHAQPEKQLTVERFDHREAYYLRLRELAQRDDAWFYVVGSDAFIVESVRALREAGIPRDGIRLDKKEEKALPLFELAEA